MLQHVSLTGMCRKLQWHDCNTICWTRVSFLSANCHSPSRPRKWEWAMIVSFYMNFIFWHRKRMLCHV